MTQKHIPETLIRAAMPNIREFDEWYPVIIQSAARWKLQDQRLAMCLAQIGHESADLTRLEENLNYSASALMRTWPSRFPSLDVAQDYERNPPMIANYVYGGRMGNTQPDDGWRFRGRGPIQITGRNNYASVERATGYKVLSKPDILATDKYAGMESAMWFFTMRTQGVNITTVTRAINGGLHGLQDRQRRYQAALRAL